MLNLSDRLKSKLESRIYTPVLVLEIDGLPVVSSGSLTKAINFDDPDFVFDMGERFDSLVKNRDILLLVDMKSSTTSLTQQMNQTNGLIGAQNYTISLVDFGGIVTEWITPGVRLDDILGKKAKVYFTVEGCQHPQDSLPLMFGFVEGYTSAAASVEKHISSVEKLKQSDVLLPTATEILDFPAFTTTVASNVPEGTGNIPVTNISGFPDPGNPFYLGPGARFRYLVKIGSDIMSYSSIAGSELVYKMGAEAVMIHRAISAGETISLYRVIDADFTEMIQLKDASMLVGPTADPSFESYVMIDDEIIKFVSIGAGRIANLTRGCFGTIPAAHEFGASVSSMYRLMGGMKDLSLKLMLSGGPRFYYETNSAPIVSHDGETVASAVFILDDYFNELGIVEGDIVDIQNSGINDRTDVEISFIGEQGGYKYLVLDTIGLSAGVGSIRIRSKYNTLPAECGLGFTPDLVDVAEHERVDTRFFGQLLTYDFKFKDKVNVAETINKQIYRPSGCFQLQKKGRASVGVTAPPLYDENTIVIDDKCVVAPSKIRINRSLSTDRFYNAVNFRYNLDPVEDKYLNGALFLSTLSTTRIKIPTKSLDIDADGVVEAAGVKDKLSNQAKRILDRFQFGAESFETSVLFSVGIQVEIGDTIIFDGSLLKMSDTAKGNAKRVFKPRIMEVTKKDIQLASSTIKLTFSDTSFSVNGRYGTIGPSSKIGAGSSAVVINVIPSYSTLLTLKPETWKWTSFIGETVAVRSPDWEFYQEVRIQSLTDTSIVLDTPLSEVPVSGFIVDMPRYPDDANPETLAKWKRAHTFTNPQVIITDVGSDRYRLPIDAGDASKFLVGCVLSVHSHDYSVLSDDMVVREIDGDEIVLTTPLPFDVEEGFEIDLIGFKDGGQPYRLI